MQLTRSLLALPFVLAAAACGGPAKPAEGGATDAPTTVESCADHALAAKKACEGSAPAEARPEAVEVCKSAEAAKVMSPLDACFKEAMATTSQDDCRAKLKPCMEKLDGVH